MAQSLSNYVSKETQAFIQVAAPTGTFTVGEVIMNGANLGASTAFGVLKAIEGTGANTVLVIDSIGGVTVSSTFYPSTVLFLDGDTAKGNTSAATAVVDTVVGADGSDLVLTTKGIERVKKVGTRVISEVVVALKDFSTRFAALKDFDTPATFTAAVTGSVDASVDVSAGEKIRITVTATEAVSVPSTAYIAVTTVGGVRQAAYVSGSGGTSIVFEYAVVVGDIGIAGTVSAGSTIVGTVQEISGTYLNPVSVSFTANAAGISVVA